ncbi:MAG: hypothetical protein V4662_24930 [Verrucomicrobiota bacterium]
MSTNRSYSINFATTADLTAAAATEKAVDKVGDAATRSGSKLDSMEREFKESMDRIKAKLDSAQASLRESGEQGGKAAGEGMGQGLNLAANLHLVGQAIEIGTMIGQALGSGLESAWLGETDQIGEKLRANLGLETWADDFNKAARKLNETLPAAVREVDAEILKDRKKFWDDYRDVTPKTASQWLVDLGTHADEAMAKLRGLGELQNAVMKMGKSQAEQDFLDEKLAIDSDPLTSKSDKMAAVAAAEEKRKAREEELRQQQRLQAAQALGAGVASKASELDAIKQREAEQEAKARAYDAAKAQADSEVRLKEKTGGKMRESDEESLRKSIFAGHSRNSGFNLDPERDENAELKPLKEARRKMERELEMMRLQAAEKAKALAIEEVTDTQASERERQRRKMTNGQAVEKQRQTEWEDSEKERAEMNDQGPPEPVGDSFTGKRPVKPGAEQTPEDTVGDLRKTLNDAAQKTGDAGLKRDLEALKAALLDGVSAAELKEAAALMERASADRNDAVRAIAQTMRGMVDAQASALAAVKQEMAALRASVENIKST